MLKSLGKLEYFLQSETNVCTLCHKKQEFVRKVQHFATIKIICGLKIKIPTPSK